MNDSLLNSCSDSMFLTSNNWDSYAASRVLICINKTTATNKHCICTHINALFLSSSTPSKKSSRRHTSSYFIFVMQAGTTKITAPSNLKRQGEKCDLNSESLRFFNNELYMAPFD